MTDPRATTMEALTGDRGHEVLMRLIETQLQDLKATQPTSDVPGADVMQQMAPLLEGAFGSLGDEMVSFSVERERPAVLGHLHAELAASILCAVANHGSIKYHEYIARLSGGHVLRRLNPFDVAQDGQTITLEQWINACIRHLAASFAQNNAQNSSLALLYLLLPDLSPIVSEMIEANTPAPARPELEMTPNERKNPNPEAREEAYSRRLQEEQDARNRLRQNHLDDCKTSYQRAREAALKVMIHKTQPEDILVRSFNEALSRVIGYLQQPQTNVGEYLRLLQG